MRNLQAIFETPKPSFYLQCVFNLHECTFKANPWLQGLWYKLIQFYNFDTITIQYNDTILFSQISNWSGWRSQFQLGHLNSVETLTN